MRTHKGPASRRSFLKSVLENSLLAAALVPATQERAYAALPFGLPPGLQLWTVKEELAADETSTLRKVASIGFRELEHYQMPESPAKFREKCSDAGLKLIGAHLEMPLPQLGSQQTIDNAAAMGLTYMIIVFPTLRSRSGPNPPKLSFSELSKVYEAISSDDYRWNADQMNLLGERIKKNGMRLGYHNHAIDLKPLTGGSRGLEILMARTDPTLIDFEMDCGHVIHAGANPITYLQRYSNRIRMLHLKDLKPGYSISTTLDTEDKDTDAAIGKGVINWKQLFAAARPGQIKHWFVEHEGKMDQNHLDSIAISYNYLKNM
jgi:sugar phosphate isomerase/epimerase